MACRDYYGLSGLLWLVGIVVEQRLALHTFVAKRKHRNDKKELGRNTGVDPLLEGTTRWFDGELPFVLLEHFDIILGQVWDFVNVFHLIRPANGRIRLSEIPSKNFL